MIKRILMTGNEAIAAGAIEAGCRFYAGYPITPQNELIAYMASHMPQAGRIFIQAESELAAINMVFGAAAAGVRAMTSSSSPGMSLKQEGISYIAGAELPAVIVNIMRGGPGLGNIAAAQSDYFQATRCGHGDFHPIVLAPHTVGEAYHLMARAFAVADKYRNPVIILGDGILGQMMEPVTINHKAGSSAIDYRLSAKPWALTGCKGRLPRVVKSFYLREGKLEEFNLRLQKKYRLIREKEQQWEEMFVSGARVVIVAYGTMARIAKAAMHRLRKEKIEVGLIRPITLWPFPEQAFRPLLKKRCAASVVVEMSYGQMVEDVQLAAQGKMKVAFVGRGGGGIPSEEDIMEKIRSAITGKI